ncbi:MULTISPECIES: CDGSH iron-sulfur domain-containing protein [unclassified Candidatus Sulfotelmatobacter]|uniref:CDGSH iron-sulfur domain-containing protein n=1 Tax=unclassified Candidatus Sulfotelmatobacter TaxID=2635724 RepID=UPI0016853E27|nr:CDGSH iron-sulfur domain-containing protein [Kocuria sp. cx-116]MBD2762338.1 CDGSH iron-sulfur domain-containing protein [Kocuria sp. cx-116]
MSADSSDKAASSREEVELDDAPATGEPQAPAPAEDPPVITVCPRGPLLVRGDFLLASEPGAEPLPPERTVIALCRCGMTSIAPHCDGSHKLATVRAFMPPKDRD